jgi:hypothetical protein
MWISLRSVRCLSSVHRGMTSVLVFCIKSSMESASCPMLLFHPVYITTYFTRSCEANRYILPFARTNVLQSSFFHRTISLWNALAADITSTTSLTIASFKRQLTVTHQCPYVIQLLSGYIHYSC